MNNNNNNNTRNTRLFCSSTLTKIIQIRLYSGWAMPICRFYGPQNFIFATLRHTVAVCIIIIITTLATLRHVMLMLEILTLISRHFRFCCIQTVGENDKLRIYHVIKSHQWRSAPPRPAPHFDVSRQLKLKHRSPHP